MVKHAQATSRWHLSSAAHDTVSITIGDNGVGFDVTESAKSGERRASGCWDG